MKHHTIIILLASCISSMGLAQAQTTTSTSTSDAVSTATGSASGTNTNIINFPGAPETNKNTVEYKGSYTVKSAPALYAPSLTTTMTDTCMGSTSMGASFSGFGLNGGTTWTDKNCVRRLDAREFRSMGMNDVAVALLCQNKDNQAAVEATGRSCPGTVKVAAATDETSIIAPEKTVAAKPDEPAQVIAKAEDK